MPNNNKYDLERLVRLLDHPDDDYWSDVLSSEARALIDRNVDEMLPQVISCWRQWPEHRLEHLAYLLGEGTSQVEALLIQELLQSPYDDVVYRAKEAAKQLNERK